jgi:hypothetical protein
MNKYSKWAQIVGSSDPEVWERSILFVKGYILALEDVLKDAKVALDWAEQTHSDPAALGRHVMETVDSLKSARVTLEVLKRGLHL